MDRDNCPSEFQFVHVDDPNAVAPASCTAVARSYVLKKFHRQKQQDARKRQVNFRYVTVDQMQSKRRLRKARAPADHEDSTRCSRDSTWDGKLDPFNCLATDVSELPTLLQDRRSPNCPFPTELEIEFSILRKTGLGIFFSEMIY